MAALGDLVVTLSTNTNPLTSGLRTGQSALKSFVGTALKLAAPISGLFGAAKSVEAARESIAVQKKLEAVIEATGGAAGITAEQISLMASDLQRLTNFEDDATKNAAAMLLTFKGVKGDIFRQAVVAAQDLAAVRDLDLNTAVVQLGKALNDPIQGMSALTRVGIQFTDSQKEQIRLMQESGNLMGAQSIILGELQTKFGGAAQAMADPWTQFKNVIGDLSENIGMLLLPSIKAITEEITAQIGGLLDNGQAFTAMGEKIANVVRAIIAWFKEWGGAIVTAIKWIVAIKAASLAFAIAQKAVAVANTIAMASMGPVGWAQIAAGAAIAAAAVAGIDAAYAGVAEAAREAGIAMGEANATPHPFQQSHIYDQSNVSSTAPAIPTMPSSKLPSSAAEETKAIATNSAQATDAIGELLEQLAIAKGQFTETDLEVSKLREGGASEWQVRQFIAVKKQLDDVRASTEAARQAQEQFNQEVAAAEQLKQSLRTPLEAYEDELKRVQTLFDKGLIDSVTLDRAKTAAEELLPKTEDPEGTEEPTAPSDPKTAGAAVKGSAEAFSAITKAMMGSQDKAAMNTANNTKAMDKKLASIDRNIGKLTAVGAGELETFT